MKTVNTLLSENQENSDSIEFIVSVCKSVAENEGVRAEYENGEMFIYDFERKEVDPTAVRMKMLEVLQEEGF